MPYILRLKRSWSVLLIPLSLGLTSIAAKNPDVTERVYSAGFYKYLSGFAARITNLVPFSMAEWVIITAAVAVVTYITASVRKIIKAPDKRPEMISRLIATLFCVLSFICFGFTVICGFNYHRLTFAALSGLDVRPSSSEELAALCKELVDNANSSAGNVDRDSGGVMIKSCGGYYDMAAMAPAAYFALGEKLPALSGYCPRPKPVVFSRAMSLADIVGIYFPFTFESNVNIDVPDYEIPSSMMHELAHYKGFMREDEANFISYLACRESGIDDFIYSGDMLALVHSINALYSADKDAYWSIIERLDPLANADLDANREYWKQFEGPVAEVSGKVNDVYLKTNRQVQGVKSYGRMVDLLLADYRKRHDIS